MYRIIYLSVIFLFIGCPQEPRPLDLNKACEPLKAEWERSLRAKIALETKSKAAPPTPEPAPEKSNEKPEVATDDFVPKPTRPELPQLIRSPNAQPSEKTPPKTAEVTNPPPEPSAPKTESPPPADPPTSPEDPTSHDPSAKWKTLRPGVKVLNREGAATSLADLAIATAVENRTPVGASNRFKSAPEKLFCFSSVNTTLDATSVTHIWRRGDSIVSRVQLNVKRSPSWRTWSRRATGTRSNGSWSCEVLDANGARIGLATAEVGE